MLNVSLTYLRGPEVAELKKRISYGLKKKKTIHYRLFLINFITIA